MTKKLVNKLQNPQIEEALERIRNIYLIDLWADDPRTVAGRVVLRFLGKYADLYYPPDILDEVNDIDGHPTLDRLESIDDEDFEGLLVALGASKERNCGCGSHGLEIYYDLIYAICNTIENFYTEVQYREARMKSWIPKPSNPKEVVAP